MVYSKPVAILNDAKCYSACDVFSAAFQDLEIGPVFGMDPQRFYYPNISGAGGAEVIGLTEYLSEVIPSYFSQLPFGIDILFAWRQVVRIGAHDGELIEDIGVKSDKVFRPVAKDFANTDGISSVWDRIADEMIQLGQSDEKYKSRGMKPAHQKYIAMHHLNKTCLLVAFLDLMSNTPIWTRLSFETRWVK